MNPKVRKRTERTEVHTLELNDDDIEEVLKQYGKQHLPGHIEVEVSVSQGILVSAVITGTVRESSEE